MGISYSSVNSSSTDDYQKSIKPFSGSESEDVKEFVEQIIAAREIHGLTEEQMFELTLNKMTGKALTWINSKPHLKTGGIDLLFVNLLKAFCREKGSVKDIIKNIEKNNNKDVDGWILMEKQCGKIMNNKSRANKENEKSTSQTKISAEQQVHNYLLTKRFF